MYLENLTQKELLEINGGKEKDYTDGHAVGTHIRDFLSTVGGVIGWLLPIVGD